MKRILWSLLSKLDNNHGYTSPLQRRYKIGDKCKINFYKLTNTKYKTGEEVIIIETGRHDYLVGNKNGDKQCVYQFELSNG